METDSLKTFLSWICILTVSCTEVHIKGYYQWKPDSRATLYCPNYCKNSRFGECCPCESLPCWEIPKINTSAVCGVTKVSLYMELLKHGGDAVIVNPLKADIYELINNDGRLNRLPDNLCEFASSLVKLDLSYNNLVDISSVKCLTELDTLHIDHNLIKSIDNTTFSSMTKLRVLTLRNNKLQYLPPNVLKMAIGNIFTTDLSFNFLDKVDVTNIFRESHSCVVNISYSSTNKVTNELDFKFNKSVMHGPGNIILEHSEIPIFPNFTEYGVSFSEMERYFSGRISIDASSLRCDCNLYPLFTAWGRNGGRYWPNIDGQEFICQLPERMKGENVSSIMREERYDKLICDLENCPHNGLCNCIDDPTLKKVIVNCTNAGLEEFPDEMPIGYWDNTDIELILTGNKITEIPSRDYLGRLVKLDLRNNSVESISTGVIKDITCLVNMEHQQLSELNPEFGTKAPTMFEFGDHPVKCDCDNLWIGEWIRVEKAYRRLNCKLYDARVMWAEDVTNDLLQCDSNTISVTVVVMPSALVLTMIIIGSWLCFVYRFSLMIVFRGMKSQSAKRKFSFDVFISFCENDEDSFFFVKDYLKSGLENSNYRTFTPWFQPLTGDRDYEISNYISNCRNYVVVLTKRYIHDYNASFEFDCMWKNFHSDHSTQLVVINLEFLESKDVRDKRMRAFLGSRLELSFRERKCTLLERLINRLGEPIALSKSGNVRSKPTRCQLLSMGSSTITSNRWPMKNV